MNLQKIISDSAAPLRFTELYNESQLIVYLSSWNFIVFIHFQLSHSYFQLLSEKTHCTVPAQHQTINRQLVVEKLVNIAEHLATGESDISLRN